MAITKVAAYLRLSREDGDKIESDSIANQRSLIKEYLKNKPDMVLVEEFSDDGYSGTSFDRPSFTRMIEAAKQKKFSCIIVKDYCEIMGLNQKDLENKAFWLSPFFF